MSSSHHFNPCCTPVVEAGDRSRALPAGLLYRLGQRHPRSTHCWSPRREGVFDLKGFVHHADPGSPSTLQSDTPGPPRPACSLGRSRRQLMRECADCRLRWLPPSILICKPHLGCLGALASGPSDQLNRIRYRTWSSVAVGCRMTRTTARLLSVHHHRRPRQYRFTAGRPPCAI